MHGFFCINKPSGPSSHDVVYQVRRAVGRGVKVGHAGTLDPFASGVLVVSVGGACRLVDLIVGRPKRYDAVVRLGAVSDTDDRTGVITPQPTAAANPATALPTLDDIHRVLPAFVGDIQQVPPRHSAVFVQGRRAYKIARDGGELNLPARPVRVDRLEVLAYDWPDLRINVWCGRGTYIRSLARDIGAALGVGGYCLELTRSAVGEFTLASAVDATELDPRRDLTHARTAVAHLPAVTLTPDDLPHLMLGRRVAVTAEQWHGTPPTPANAPTSPAATRDPATPRDGVAIFSPKGQVLAMGYLAADGLVQPTKVIVDVKTWCE